MTNPNRAAPPADDDLPTSDFAVSSFISSAIGPIRSVVDADGTFWQVCEVEFALDRRSGRSLVFESDVAVRRVRNYPEAWHSLPEKELARLLHST